MMRKEVPDRWARIEAPSWLWGGRPRQLFLNAGFQVKAHQPGEAIVTTQESYTRTRADLVRLLRVAGPAASRDWPSLNSMGDEDVDSSARHVMEEYFPGTDQDKPSLLGLVTFYQIATAAAPVHAIGDQAQAAFESLQEGEFEDGDKAFPNAGVYAIKRSEQLIHRIKIVSVLLRLQHDEVMRDGDIGALIADHSAQMNVFAASSGLQEGFYLLDQYIGPVLGALTPAIWGFAAHRAHGPIIFSFGRQVAGTTPLAPNLLSTLPTRGADRITEFAELAPDAVPSALAWWVGALNDLFAVISDPAVFRGADGDYQPAIQLQAILTVEQLFTRVLSIQAADGDTNARRVLLFTVLDTVEALTGRSISLTAQLTFAERTLKGLRASLPPSAAELLLPRADSAVSALRDMQSGFFLREPDGSILLRPSVGQTTPPEKAVAEYLKILRNATHGHGAKKLAETEISDSLLARHDGTVPHVVALLGWLYLLDILDRPDSLRSFLVARSRRGRK